LKYAAKTDKGLVRSINEDCYNIVSGCPGITAAFIIADGMGGHNAGEIASSIAVEHISDALRESSFQVAENSDFKDEKMSEIILERKGSHENRIQRYR
jgi:protein phosphatase